MKNFSKISFQQDEVEYIAPSWQDLDQLAFAIAQSIYQNQQKFERIVTLAKGGWPLTRSLVDYLQIKKVASIGVQFYQSGVNKRYKTPNIYQDIPISVRGENVLLFDDVADTGTSLEFTINYLKTRGVSSVTTASLFYKPHSNLKPNYFAAETEAWIVFPYDLVEMIKTLGIKWLQAGIEKQEIKNRFLKLSFQPETIDYFLDKLLTNDNHDKNH